MFEKFGEFDSCEELNRAAAAQLAEGDEGAIIVLAKENGIDREDAEDYIGGFCDRLATPLMAAIGKLELEKKDLGIQGVMEDWVNTVISLCQDEEDICRAVRRKGKTLRDCMAALLRYSFENKVQVSDKIVKATKVTHNGKEEPMRGPLYLGIPTQAEAKRIIRGYYLGDEYDGV